MARSPRKPKAEPKASSQLLEALKFLSLGAKDIGSPNETHVILSNNQAHLFNGSLALNHPIEEGILACPHIGTLITALSKCGQTVSITQLENHRISVKSDKFRAIVPCIEPGLLPIATPDLASVEVNDNFKKALEVVNTLTQEDAQNIYSVSILLNGQSVISTFSGKIVIEYWHGFNLPSGIAIPKNFAQIISKSNKPIISIGGSYHSVTVHFNDMSWIKTNLYAEQWPDIGHILNGPSNPFPLPPGFWEGVGAVAPFSPDGIIHFDQDAIRSHLTAAEGASYEVPGLPRGPSFNAKQLMLIKPYMETVDWFARTSNGMPCMKFFGQQLRGAVAGRNEG